MITLQWKLYTLLLTLTSILLLGFEINGLQMLFGWSVYVGAGSLIALCQIYIWKFMKKTPTLIVASFVLSMATISFASFDVIAHWRNSAGQNVKITFELQETDRNLTSLLAELRSLEVEERRLPASFGSPTKRQEARTKINDRKDFVNQGIQEATAQKKKLLDKTSSDPIEVVAKLGLIGLLQLVFLVLLSNNPSKYKHLKEEVKVESKELPKHVVKKKPKPLAVVDLETIMESKPITKEEVNLIETVLQSPQDKTVRYPFDPTGKEALYKRALEHGLVFEVRGQKYTHSKLLATFRT